MPSEGTVKEFESNGAEILDSVMGERVLNFDDIEEGFDCDEATEVFISEGLEEFIDSDGTEAISSSRRRKRNS